MKQLADIVGAEHVLTDPDLKASYETDWTQRFTGSALCVVRPASTEEVAAVLRACAAEGLKVTVQGGNTGLVGGGVPAGGDVLVSLTRLSTLGTVDPASAQVTVGAGVTLAALQGIARDAGFDVGVDLAARDSATIGGLIATNAGGIRVLRYGSMRQQVVGLTAVLPDGSVFSRMAGLEKDGTGYDLMGLIAGSEGTLAIVTEARVRLVPRFRARAVALLAFSSTQAAVDVLPGLRSSLPSLAAAELFYAPGLALVRKHSGLAAPFPEEHEAYLLVECADLTDPTSLLVQAVETADGLVDARIADDAAGQRALWAYRETHTESISAEGVPVKLDVSVPVRSLPSLVERLAPTIAGVAPSARPIVFGHVNEGNLHVNVLDAGDLHEEVSDAVLRLVASLDGSISSEHGVGRAKVPWLSLSRSTVEIETMRSIKAALDPHGLLNPGVLFP
ncbi:MAG: linked oxidase domain protein [Frankiales bacterium]|nr:linked oxidase domain protein [Frankiales bacterium]